MAPKSKVNIFWFRRDLRLKDNTGLIKALESQHPVLPLFIFDTNILLDLEDKQDPRVGYIHDRLNSIAKDLKHNGSGILIKYGTPSEVIKDLLQEFTIQGVYTNRDYEPYGRGRDSEIKRLLYKSGVAFHSFKDHMIFGPEEILKDNGEPFRVYTPYKRKWLHALDETDVAPQDCNFQSSNFYKNQIKPTLSLNNIGFEANNLKIPSPIIDTSIVKNYDQTRNFPAISGTSRIGIHLRHGSVSIRKAVTVARKLNETWLNELIWREFYMMILFHFPHVVHTSFKKAYDHIPWRNDPEEFRLWCEGNTGYPIVDAGMRELNGTGYMHNRVRMITASFLTKHLLIDWRWGEAYFARKLLDYELSSNNGGWQWAAGTGTDAQPYFRVFNPYLQAEKFDPDEVYIKKWVPEYGSSSYTPPIIDHKIARERAIKTYKEAVS